MEGGEKTRERRKHEGVRNGEEWEVRTEEGSEKEEGKRGNE